jgi:hypothetical protein
MAGTGSGLTADQRLTRLTNAFSKKAPPIPTSFGRIRPSWASLGLAWSDTAWRGCHGTDGNARVSSDPTHEEEFQDTP